MTYNPLADPERFPVPRIDEDGVPIEAEPLNLPRVHLSPAPKRSGRIMPPRRHGSGDVLRMMAYHNHRDDGVEPLDAWWMALSGPLEHGGLRKWIGKDRPKDGVLLSTLRKHSLRVQPGQANESIQIVRDDLRGLADRAVTVVRDILERRPEKDEAAGANVQLAAAKATLEYSGVAPTKGGVQVNTQVNVQSNSGEDGRDRVRAIVENPGALRAAIDLERALAGSSGGDGAGDLER